MRDAFVRARDEGVRVLLFVEAEELKKWRWERLCGPVDADVWDFLSLDQRMQYSLYLPSMTDRPYPPIGRRDLRALVVVACPDDSRLHQFDVAESARRLRAALGEKVKTEVLETPELDEVLAALTAGSAEGPYTILHVVCHGWVNRKSETVLYWKLPVDGTMLIERLRRVARLPHLVFLSTCESSAPEAEQGLGGLAQRLVRELGIPAVIGMTERVTIPTASALADNFYRRLLAQSGDGEADRALVEAYAGLASRADVNVPALYSRLGGRPLFSAALDTKLTAEEIRIGLQRLDDLLVERAPVLRAVLAERAYDLEAVGELCEEVIEVEFQELARGKTAPEYDSRQPFRGLSAFRTGDQDFFFGREALVQKLEQKLREDRFLPILGRSGSGKSSVVMAGLIPKLGPEVEVVYLTPGKDPLEQLRIRQAELSEKPGVYVVDQFEELFTLCSDEKEREGFIDEVLRLAGKHRVILTMRADFWGRCAKYTALKDRMQARQELIGPMTMAELRAAMEQQAEQVKLRFEADLTNTMLDEVDGEAGAMPLLQHALLELWKRRHGRWLRTSEFRVMEGVKQSIAKTADRVYEQLGSEDREAREVVGELTPRQKRMRDVFVRLTRSVVTGEERWDAGQRLSVQDLTPHGSDVEETRALLAWLAGASLIVTDRNDVTGQDEVMIAHDALTQYWKRLQDWQVQWAAQGPLRDGVRDAAAEWNRKPDDEGLLVHHGSRLVAAKELLVSELFELTKTEHDYIRACAGLEEREQKKERELGEARARAYRWLALTLAAGLVLAVFAVWRVREQSRVSLSKQLAAQSLGARDKHLDLALLLALQATRVSRNVDSRGALLAGMLAHPKLVGYLRGYEDDRGERNEAWTVAFSQDGNAMASGHFDGSVYLWDVSKRSGVRLKHAAMSSVSSVALNEDGTILAAGASGAIHVYHRQTGSWEKPYVTGLGENQVWWHVSALALNADATQMASSFCYKTNNLDEPEDRCVQAQINLWRVGNSVPEQTLKLDGSEVKALAFGRDGTLWIANSNHVVPVKWGDSRHSPSKVLTDTAVQHLTMSKLDEPVACGPRNEQVICWDVRKNKVVTAFTNAHYGSVGAIAFSPETQTIASAGSDTNLVLWQSERPQRIAKELKLEKTVFTGGIAISRDGSFLVAANDASGVYLDLKTLRQTQLTGKGPPVRGVALSPDEVRLALPQEGGVAIWKLTSPPSLEKLLPIDGSEDYPWRVAFRSDGMGLASGGNKVHQWDPSIDFAPLSTLLVADGDNATVYAVAYSRDGRRLAAGGQHGIAVFDADTGRVLSSRKVANPVSGLAFTVDGNSLAFGMLGGAMGITSTTLQAIRSPLTGNDQYGGALQYDKEGKLLIWHGSDGNTRLWDVAENRLIGTLPGGSLGVDEGLAISDTRVLAVSGEKGTVNIWDLDESHWAQMVCGIVNRDLTQEEWDQYVGGRKEEVCPDAPAQKGK